MPSPQELVDGAAEAADVRHERVEDRVQLAGEVSLRDLSLGRLREPAQVEEQHRRVERVVQHLRRVAELVDADAAALLVLEHLVVVEGPQQRDPVAQLAQDLEPLDAGHQVEEHVDHLVRRAVLHLGLQPGGGGELGPGLPDVAEEVGHDVRVHHDLHHPGLGLALLLRQLRQVAGHAREEAAVVLPQPPLGLAHQDGVDLEEQVGRDPVALVGGQEQVEVEVGDADLLSLIHI